MKVTPTSGPIAASSTHHARDAISSRVSLRSSHPKAIAEFAESVESPVFSARSASSAVACLSGERKEDLFQIVARIAAACRRCVGQLLERAFAAHAAAAQEHEPIADARGVTNLVDREEHRASRRRVRAEG